MSPGSRTSGSRGSAAAPRACISARRTEPRRQTSLLRALARLPGGRSQPGPPPKTRTQARHQLPGTTHPLRKGVTQMKRLILSIGSLAAVLALAVGLDSALAANHSPGAAVKVAVANSGLGRVLVDGRGRTLYLFEKDNHGKSACTGKC